MVFSFKLLLGGLPIAFLPVMAGAGWIEISPHDKAAPGSSAEPAGWSGGNWTLVEDAAAGAGNRVLRSGKAATGSTVTCIRLPAPIPADAAAATVSFRFRMRTPAGDGPRVVWGLSVRELANVAWGAQAVQWGLGFEEGAPFLKVRSGAKSEVLLRELQSGQWYRVWHVLDNRAGKQAFYISTSPGAAGPANLLRDDLRYRSDAPRGALEYLAIIRERGDMPGSIEFDDIFVDPTGRNLTVPGG